MALVQCQECSASISTQAAACPHCGAKPAKPAKVSKPTSRVTWLFVALAVIGVTGAGINSELKTAGMSPAQIAAQETVNKAANTQENARYDMARGLAKSVKASMRDPDSFKVEFIGVNADASVGCLEYRAKNGFGGMNRATAVLRKNKLSGEVADWNKHCTQPLFDQTAAAG